MKGLAGLTNALVGATSKMMGGVRERGGAAVTDLRNQPQHARWRIYALGSYGLLVAGTLAAQLYKENKIDAYVRVQRVDLPAVTQIFVRNDSELPWKDVRLTLNGIYAFEASELRPGRPLMLQVSRFSVPDSNGRMTYAPKTIVPQQLSIDCDRGHFDANLLKK